MSLTDASGHYAKHLADASQSNPATTTEDIYNTSGALVVPRNQVINPKIARQLAQHKLRKPLSASIALARTLNQDVFLELMLTHMERLKLRDVMNIHQHRRRAVGAILQTLQYPLIVQKLTVMSEQLPVQFQRSLMCACFSLGICHELKLDDESTERVFMSNLIADLGLLHIDPNIVLKTGKYSPEEWQLMKGHVAISAAIAALEPALDARIQRAVIEHHERADGFGYPFGKRGAQLCLESQVVAVADTVSALYRKLVIQGKRSQSMVVAVFELPSTAHDGAIRNATLRMMKRAKIDYQPSFAPEQVVRIVAKVSSKRSRLKAWVKRVLAIYQGHAKAFAGSQLVSIQLAEKLINTVGTTGLLSDIQQGWLASLTLEPEVQELQELEEFQLKIDELEYQCRFILNALASEIDAVDQQLPAGYSAQNYHQELSQMLLGSAPAQSGASARANPTKAT